MGVQKFEGGMQMESMVRQIGRGAWVCRGLKEGCRWNQR